jgi:hypothetical protein
VTVDTLKLVGSTHNPATQIAIANGVFSQCNVRILHGVNADDSTAAAPQTTTWLGGDTDIAAGTSCAAVTAEERRLFRDGSSHYGPGRRPFQRLLRGHGHRHQGQRLFLPAGPPSDRRHP